jgi:hypothetical protein
MSSPNYRKMSLQELIQQEGCFRPDHPQGSGPRAELERRRFWQNLWTQGIPAWLALIISIVALYVSIILK